jgi:hypothetical protein
MQKIGDRAVWLDAQRLFKHGATVHGGSRGCWAAFFHSPSGPLNFTSGKSCRGMLWPLLASVSGQGETRQGHLVDRAMMPIHHRSK